MGRCDHDRVAAHRRAPASPLTSRKPSLQPTKDTPGPVEPLSPGPPAGPPSYPDAKITAINGASRRSASAINPDERSGPGPRRFCDGGTAAPLNLIGKPTFAATCSRAGGAALGI